MNYSRFLLAAVLVLATAGVAHANAVDPSIIFPGRGLSTSVGTSFVLTTTMGNFHTFDLVNDQEGTSAFKDLRLTVNVTTSLPSSTSFSCSGGSFFDSCIAPPDTTLPSFGPFSFLFSGGPGILVGDHFSIQIAGWGDSPNTTTIQGKANVPEPATITLMLLGVGAVGLRRKLISA